MLKNPQQLYTEGNTLLDQGKYQEAITSFKEILTLDKGYLPAYRGHLRCYYALGDYQKSIEWCDKSLAIDATYQYGLDGKAHALHKQGKTPEALKLFDQAIELYPEWEVPYKGKGDCLLEINKKKEAIECFKKHISLVPKDLYARRNLALCLENIGRKEEAKDTFDKALILAPSHALFLCDRGVLLNQMGFKTNAQSDFRKAHKSIQEGFVETKLGAEHFEFLKKALAAAVEAADMGVKAEAALKKEDEGSSLVRKHKANIAGLQGEVDKAMGLLLGNVKRNDPKGSEELIKQLGTLKEQQTVIVKDIKGEGKGEHSMMDESHAKHNEEGEEEKEVKNNRSHCCNLF